MNLKNFLALSLLAIFAFTSCSSDDDNSIVGVWQYTQETSPSAKAKSNNPQFTAVLEEYIVDDVTVGTDYILEFKEDGSYIITYKDDSDIEKGTYTYKNGVVTMTTRDEDEDEDDVSSTPVSISGNSLIVTTDVLDEFVDEDGSFVDYVISYIFNNYTEDLKDVKKEDITSITEAKLTMKLTRK